MKLSGTRALRIGICGLAAIVLSLADAGVSSASENDDARFNGAMLQFSEAGKFEIGQLLGRKLVDSRCEVPAHMNGPLQVESIVTEACLTHFDSAKFYCGDASVVLRTSIDFGDVSEDPIDWPEDELGERTVFAIALQSNSSSRNHPLFSKYGGKIRTGLVDSSGRPFNLTTLSRLSLRYRRILHEIDARSTSFHVSSAERLEELRSLFAERQERCGSKATYSSHRITHYWSPRSLDEATFDWTFPLNEPFQCQDPLIHGKLLDGRWRKREFTSWRELNVEADNPSSDTSPVTVTIGSVGDGVPPISIQYKRAALKIICTVPEYIVWEHGRGGSRVARFKAGDTFTCRNPLIKGDPAGNTDRHVSYQSTGSEGNALVDLVASRTGRVLIVLINGRALTADGAPVELLAESIHVKCDA